MRLIGCRRVRRGVRISSAAISTPPSLACFDSPLTSFAVFAALASFLRFSAASPFALTALAAPSRALPSSSFPFAH